MPRMTREESRADTRRRLRHAAAASFAKHGFEGASVDQISEYAGFSRGAFYSNYAGKEAIFLELLVRHLERDITWFERVVRTSTTLEQFTTNLTAGYRDLGEHPDWCLLASEFQLYASREGRADSPFTALYEDYRTKLAALLTVVSDRFAFTGELNPRQLASALIGLSHGLALERAASQVVLPIDVTGMAIRALLHGAAGSVADVRSG